METTLLSSLAKSSGSVYQKLDYGLDGFDRDCYGGKVGRSWMGSVGWVGSA